MGSLCELIGKHSEGVGEYIGGGAYRLICPECGDSAIFTMKDMEEAIIEALTQEGKYTNIVQIPSSGLLR